MLSLSQLALGRVSAALEAVRNALILNPAYQEALELKLRVLKVQADLGEFEGCRGRGHWKGAEASIQRALDGVRVDGHEPVDWLMWQIEVFISQGKWEEAIELSK